jgi:hypothetical protein
MNEKIKIISGWTLSTIVSLAMAASAVDKIILSVHALEVSKLVGISAIGYRTLGVIEILSTILFVIPRTGLLGLLLLSSYLGGAIATHLQHGQPTWFPALFECVVWIGAVIRFPELSQRMKGE